MKLYCTRCGKEFEAKSRLFLYCSMECKKAARKSNYTKKEILKKCAYCGKDFQTSYARKVYCSSDCAIAAEKERRKERNYKPKPKKKEQPKKQTLSLKDVDKLASEEGLTYGQWVAKHQTLNEIESVEEKRKWEKSNI